jgi:hypothetical protein
MRLWTTSEAMFDVDDAVSRATNLIEAEDNRSIQGLELIEEAEKWTLIAIVLPKELEPAFPEVVRRSSKRKVLEFRLHIAHAEFLHSTENEQTGLVFDCLFRSIDLMPKLKVKPDTQTVLREVLAQARRSLAA